MRSYAENVTEILKFLLPQSPLFMSIILILGPEHCETKFLESYTKLENKEGCAARETFLGGL